MSGYPYGEEPWWVTQDEDREREDEPLMTVPCPCCGGNGHDGQCGARLATLRRALEAANQNPRPGSSILVYLDGYVAATGEGGPDLTITCSACHDTGVVPLDEWGRPDTIPMGAL